MSWLYQLWSGRTADQATAQSNMSNLAIWLQQHGYCLQQTLVIGDRAMLSDEIALAYDHHQLLPGRSALSQMVAVSLNHLLPRQPLLSAATSPAPVALLSRLC